MTDYIVDCHSSARRGGALHVFAGSNEYVVTSHPAYGLLKYSD